MIAADSNIFLRWLIGDDKAKADKISRLLKKTEKGGGQIWVSDLVMGEVVWVLQRFYQLKPAEAAEMVEPLLDAPMLNFENRDRLMRTLELFRAHEVDFTDCYIAACALEKGLDSIVSYDRDFEKLPVKRMEP